MKTLNIIFAVSAFAVVAGLFLGIFNPTAGAYIYLPSAVLFAIMQYVCRPRSENFVVRRLVAQQFLAGFALVVAGVLMFTHTRNEWIIALAIGTFVEVYTTFRISSIIDKEEKS